MGKQAPVLDGIEDRQLLFRGVMNARDRHARKGQLHPRWVAVQSVFGLGQHYAKRLCESAGLDPFEEIAR